MWNKVFPIAIFLLMTILVFGFSSGLQKLSSEEIDVINKSAFLGLLILAFILSLFLLIISR
jgi:hypothetical protein